MVKNAVNIEYARCIRVNADEQARVDKLNENNRALFDTAYKAWSADKAAAMYAFNEERQKEIARLAGLRIEVPARFQSVVDEFLKDIQE